LLVKYIVTFLFLFAYYELEGEKRTRLSFKNNGGKCNDEL